MKRTLLVTLAALIVSWSWSGVAVGGKKAKAKPPRRVDCLKTYFEGDLKRALAICEAVLQVRPKDQKIRAVAGAAACKLRLRPAAQRHHCYLGASRRLMHQRVCAKHGVKVSSKACSKASR